MLNSEGHQEVLHMNCPKCGRPIEVICPATDVHVRKVLEAKWESFFEKWIDNANDHSKTICVFCGREVWVAWYY